MYYVIIPLNTTDTLQPKAAKDFLRAQFQAWYAEKIAVQMTGSQSSCCTPVEVEHDEASRSQVDYQALRLFQVKAKHCH